MNRPKTQAERHWCRSACFMRFLSGTGNRKTSRPIKNVADHRWHDRRAMRPGAYSATASDTVSVTAIPASHFAFRKSSVIFITVIWFALLPVLTQMGIS